MKGGRGGEKKEEVCVKGERGRMERQKEGGRRRKKKQEGVNWEEESKGVRERGRGGRKERRKGERREIGNECKKEN